MRRALSATGAGLLATVTFVIATALGIILHVGTPPARRALAAQITAALAETFEGRIVVESFRGLGLGGFDGLRATAYDPEGKRVLLLDGVRAKVGFPSLALAILTPKREVQIVISELRIAAADVLLEEDAAGVFSLERAFEPRASTQASSQSGPTLSVSMPRIGIGHASVHARMKALPNVDAEVDEARGSVLAATAKTEVDIAPFELTAHGLVESNIALKGRAEVHVAEPSSTGRGTDARVAFEGHLGDVQAAVHALMQGDHVELTVDVPRTAPAAVLPLVHDYPIRDAVSAHLEARGDLPVLYANLRANVGEGEIDMSGAVTLTGEPRAELTINATNIDPRSFDPNAPRAKVTAVTRAAVVLKQGGELAGDFRLRTLPTTLGEQAIPAITAGGAFTGHAVRGWANLDESGAPTDLRFYLHPDEARRAVVDFQTRTAIRDLGAVRRLSRVAARGHASVHVHGRVALSPPTVDALVDADAGNLARGEMSARWASVVGHVHGPMRGIELDATVRGYDVQVAGHALTDVALTTQGRIESPFVTVSIDGRDLPHIGGHGAVRLGDTTSVHGAEVEVKRNGVAMIARVASARLGGGALDLDGIVVTGLGAPVRGEVHVTPRAFAIKASAPDIDLTRVAALVGEPDKIEAGRLAFEVDLVDKKDQANGHVDATLTGGSFLHVRGAEASVAFRFEGRRMEGTATGKLGDTANLDVTARNATLGGSPLDVKSWARATGNIYVESSVDLARLAVLVPEESLPISGAAGVLQLKAVMCRLATESRPDVRVIASTKGLVLEGKPNAHDADVPWRTSDVDVELAASVDGTTGRTELQTSLVDARGTFASLGAQSSLSFVELAHDPARALALLEAAPLALHLDVPERALDQLPPVFRPSAVRGFVGGVLDATGTAREPRVLLRAKARDLRSMNPQAAVPIDVALDGRYNGTKGDVKLAVMRPEGVVLEATSHVNARLDDLRSAAPGTPVPWDASANVRLAGFPIESVPAMADRDIAGKVSGSLRLTGLHDDAKLDARLDVAGLRLQNITFARGELELDATAGNLRVATKLERADGTLRADATAGIVWGADLAPVLDKTRPIEASLYAKNFRAGALLPLVKDTLNELDGRIDADAKIHVLPGFKDGSMDGAIVLSNGVFEIPALGEEFRNVHARVDIQPWGTVRVQNVSAEALNGGRLNAEGSAKLDGLRFRSAEAKLRIPEDRRLPLTVEGVPLGEAWGNVDIKAQGSEDGNTILVTADIPIFHAELPQASGHDVQSLGANPNIAIGVQKTNGEFVRLPMHAPLAQRKPGAEHIRVVVHLGEDVQVKRGAEIEVSLTGSPTIDITDKPRMSGQVQLRQGIIDVFGKRFRLERGVVNFHGDNPGDPEVVVTASWDAPDGTRVYADVTGRAKTIRVRLYSEPARSQNEILSLLLFGTTDGQPGMAPPDRQADPALRAAGVAGGYVTQGLNKILSGVSSLEVQTRVDTTDAQNPRPEVQVQLSREILVDVAYNLGLPAPGQNPDRTELRVDYRFRRNWSLLTTIGDKGSSIIDLIWHYRY